MQLCLRIPFPAVWLISISALAAGKSYGESKDDKYAADSISGPLLPPPRHVCPEWSHHQELEGGLCYYKLTTLDGVVRAI